MAATAHDFPCIDPASTPASPSATASIAPRVIKLCYLNRAKLFSPPLSRLTFSQLLSLVARAFPETQSGESPSTTLTTQQSSASRIELTYSSEDGGTVIIDSEESFSLAALSFQETHRDVIKLRIYVKNDATSSGVDCSTGPSPSAATSFALRLKLCYLNRAKIFSLIPLSFLTFSKLLLLVARAFPETQNGERPTTTTRQSTAHRIELTFSDGGGDTVIIDSEESFSLAAHTFQETHGDVMKLRIYVKNDEIRRSGTGYFAHDAPRSASQASDNWRSHIPCRYFRTGSCKFGSSCEFLHNATDYTELTKDASLSDAESEIDEWISTLRSSSEPDIVSYLISPEGYNNFLLHLNYPSLPQIAFYQLASLLTRPKLRTSLLQHEATDKIYNALLGSQFLSAMHLHIRARVKPILGCIEPYVFLCEELMSRTSVGWKEVPLDELTTLVDEVKSNSVMELKHILAGLVDLRAKKKKLEAVGEKSGTVLSPEGLNFGEMPIIPPKELFLLQENSCPVSESSRAQVS